MEQATNTDRNVNLERLSAAVERHLPDEIRSLLERLCLAAVHLLLCLLSLLFSKMKTGVLFRRRRPSPVCLSVRVGLGLG